LKPLASNFIAADGGRGVRLREPIRLPRLFRRLLEKWFGAGMPIVL
jgi:hypothetical protein